MRPFFTAGLAVVSLFVSGVPAVAAETLFEEFSRKGVVKAYVMEPSDTTTDKKVEPATLKKQVEEALTGRKSVRFELAPTRESADVAVETTVTEYYWTDHDPIDMIVGVGGTAYDAMRDEHYARVRAVFAVTDTKAGKPLWKEELQGTVTDGTMKQEEGPRRAGEKLAQQFVSRAFGKKKGRR